MAMKMVMIVPMMLVGALALKYSQNSDALVAGKDNNTGVNKKAFHAVAGNGWCVDAAGQESTARTKALILKCKHAEMLCAKDSMCVAFACVDSKPFAVLYTTTNCNYACNKLDWITHPQKITKAGHDDRQEMKYWESGACFVAESSRAQESTALSTNCDFELDLCGWSVVSDLKFVRKLGTSAADTAHTGTGYAFASSSGAYANSKYVLESPYLGNFATSSEQALLHFWYHMEGAEQGNLSLKCTHDGAQETIWSHSGNQPNGWTQVTAEIPKSQCRFEADTKTAGQSDIAIDDVTITKMEKTRSCNFEEDTCESLWDTAFPTGSSRGWHRHTGYTMPTNAYTVSSTGPAQAATGEFYLVVDASGNNAPDKSFTFRSKSFQTDSDQTLEFKYNMFGAHMGKLYVRAYMQDGSIKELYAFSGQQNVQSAWLSKSVTVPSGATMIEFEGVTGQGAHSDMAIDDITFNVELKYP